jgi:hypothetical protein
LVFVLTSVVVRKLSIATDDDLFDLQGTVFASRGLARDQRKEVMVEVYFARAAFDDDVTAFVCHGSSPLRLLRFRV